MNSASRQTNKNWWKISGIATKSFGQTHKNTFKIKSIDSSNLVWLLFFILYIDFQQILWNNFKTSISLCIIDLSPIYGLGQNDLSAKWHSMNNTLKLHANVYIGLFHPFCPCTQWIENTWYRCQQKHEYYNWKGPIRRKCVWAKVCK